MPDTIDLIYLMAKDADAAIRIAATKVCMKLAIGCITVLEQIAHDVDREVSDRAKIELQKIYKTIGDYNGRNI